MNTNPSRTNLQLAALDDAQPWRLIDVAQRAGVLPGMTGEFELEGASVHANALTGLTFFCDTRSFRISGTEGGNPDLPFPEAVQITGFAPAGRNKLKGRFTVNGAFHLHDVVVAEEPLDEKPTETENDPAPA